MKKTVSIILACVFMLSTMSIGIFGAVPEQISPMWNNAFTFTAEMSFVQTTGRVAVTILGQSGVNNITAEIKLYYKNTSGSWTEIPQGWNYNVNQQFLSINESFTGVAGREYKIEVEANVKKNNIVETLSKTATAVCPRT